MPQLKRFFFICLPTVYFFGLQNSYSISLTEAIKNKWISASVTGIDYRNDSVYRSSFYGHCLKINCINLRSVPIEITEPAGRFLLPDDSLVQRMIITAPLSFKLTPNEKRTVPFFAMCTESNDVAPDDKDSFAPGGIAPKELLTVVNFISQHHWQNEAAQQAIWCITNYHSPYSIYSDDTLMSEQLRKLVCDLLKTPYTKGKNDEESSPRFRIVDGAFEYTIERSKTVDLVIYNESGQLVRNCVDHELQEAGTHKYAYHFTLPINDDALLKQSLLIRFYLNDQLITERKHELSSR